LRDDFGDELPIIFVSRDRTESYDRMAGLLIGADEYLAMPCPSDEFLLRVGRLVRRASPSPPPHRPAVSTLTARELEILQLLVRGLAQKEIAAHLHLSPKTVNSHIERVYEKLGVHSRTQAITAALRMGLADLERATSS